MTEPDPIDNAATQFQDAGDEYVAWTPPPPAMTAYRKPAYRGPKMGTVLRSDQDGASIVVPEGTDPLDALIDLVVAFYGGTFSRSNPVLAATAADLRVQQWWSCTKAWREANGALDWDDYWAPDGDGARFCHVIHTTDDLYELGREAAAAEPIARTEEVRDV